MKQPGLEGYDAWHHRLAALEDGALETPGGLNLQATWHRMVLEHVGDLRGASVAEVGCGRGDLAIHLARAGAQVVAVDVSTAAIAAARERARRHQVDVDFQVGDAQATGLPGERFDLVLSCECLEHVPTPRDMARELFRIARPGARCLVTTPSYLNGMLLAWLQAWLTGRPLDSGAGVQPRENFFIYPAVRRLLTAAGFRVREVDGRILQLLLLPRVDPARLRIERFHAGLLNRLARPFFLHLLYVLERPSAVHLTVGR